MLIVLAAFSAQATLAAPSITLSAPSVQSGDNTTLTHTISGIAAGETVTVERFADLNNNGAIDFGEPPLRTFVVKDGVRPTIGGVVNGNVPGDDDGAVNDAIRIDLPFPGVDPFMNRQPGKYLVRISCASGQATTPFEITAPNLPQRVTGVLKNSANNANIPFGIIVILVGEGTPIGSVRTDATGAYTFVAPAGDYVLIPVSDGFMTSMQFVSIPPNQTVTQNLTLTPGPVRVSGKLSDASTGAGLPGVFILAQAGSQQSQQISGALTDLNGNYSFSVTSGDWEVGPLSFFTSQLGYVNDKHSSVVTALASPITHNLTVQKATALIYGKATNPNNAAVAGLSLRAQEQAGGLESEGRTFANGDYFLGTLGGNWDAHTEGATTLGFRDESKTFAVTDSSATKWDLRLASFTAHIFGHVVYASGLPVQNTRIQGRYNDSQQPSTETNTDSDGNFDMPVWGGNWSIELSPNLGAVNHSVNVTVVDGVNQNLTYVVPDATGEISGTVKNRSNQGLAGVFVNGNATIGGVEYRNSTQTDATGHYRFQVINGIWNVSLSCDELRSQNLDCPPNQVATINNNSATINFNLTAFVTTASINGRLVDASGAGISGFQIGAYNQASDTSRSASSAGDGSFSIPVYAGQWSVQVFNLPNQYISPELQYTVTDGVNINNVQIQLLTADATLTGTLKTTSGAAVAGINIYAGSTQGNLTYHLPYTTTDANGAFSFAVYRGTWNLTLDCNELSVHQFNCTTPAPVDTTSGSATVNIVLTPQGAPQIEAPSINLSGQIPIFRFTLRAAPGTYDIFGNVDLKSPWNQLLTTTIGVGGNISTPEFNPGAYHFFKVQLRQ